MIHRLLRICGFLVSILLGVVFLLGALGGVLLRVAGHFALRSPSSLRGNDKEELRKTEKRSNFVNRVKRGAVFGVVALLVAGVLGGVLIAVSGIVPIAASSGHWPITEWFLQFAMRRSISTHSLGIEVPPLDDSDLILKGATHYEIGCRPCHGSPGLPLPRIPQNMTPHPPDLSERVREAEPEELFYVVKHGVKFTGMPAWPAIQREDEVWAVVAFLRELNHLDQTGYRQLVDGDSPGTPPIYTMGGLPAVPPIVTLSCTRCHGADGIGRGTGAFPKLAGQREAYLENALRAYSRGERHSGIMEPNSAGLSEEAIREVARYYAAAVAADPAPPNVGDEAAIERGRLIAQHGTPAERVPSCIDCHAPKGERFNANYPALEAQHADYLLLQLELFNKSRRGGSAYAHVMEPIAKRLKPQQMRDVALYFQSLRPRHTAQTHGRED